MLVYFQSKMIVLQLISTNRQRIIFTVSAFIELLILISQEFIDHITDAFEN